MDYTKQAKWSFTQSQWGIFVRRVGFEPTITIQVVSIHLGQNDGNCNAVRRY